MTEMRGLKDITKAHERPAGQEIGIFLLLIAIVLITSITFFVLGWINDFILFIAVLVVLGIIYLKSPSPVIELAQYERAVILRFGKFLRVAGPGWIVIMPFIDDPRVVDTRVMTRDIEPQKVLTQDHVTLMIDAIVFLKIVDPKKSVLEVKDAQNSVTEFVRAHLRDVMGDFDLVDIIKNVNKINKRLREETHKVSKDWGIEIYNVEVQRVDLPDEVRSAMHKKEQAKHLKEAARREAEAVAIRIEELEKAAGGLTDPSLQYLYLQALEKVAAGRSSKIIFPIELTHLADRLGAKMAPAKKEKLGDELREKYDEFVLEAAREGVSPQDLLASLKKAPKSNFVKKHHHHKTKKLKKKK